MLLGAELFSRRDVLLEANSYVEMCLLSNGVPIKSSFGRDEFESSTLLSAGSRVSATGRLSVFYANPLMLHQQARPAWPVSAGYGPKPPPHLSVLIRSNAFLDPLYFLDFYCVHLVTRNPDVVRVFEPYSSTIEYEWIGRGTFRLRLPPGWHLPIPN
ncbi:MAG: hypothetical protein ACPLPR_04130 [Bacillota bacterium]